MFDTNTGRLYANDDDIKPFRLQAMPTMKLGESDQTRNTTASQRAFKMVVGNEDSLNVRERCPSYVDGGELT